MIIIINNDKFTQNTISNILINSGISKNNLKICSNGEEALELCYNAQEPPDLIITDINTKNINGFELCKIIRKMDSPCKNIPILFVSAENNKFENITKSLLVGGDGYESKPINKKSFKKKIDICLNLSKVRKDIRQLNYNYQVTV